MNVDKTAIELDVKSASAKLPTSSSVTKESIRLSRNFTNSLEVGAGEMAKNGDEFLAVDTYIIANLQNDPFKEILGKYVDIRELIKTFESVRAGQKIQSQTADENLESLSKYGIDLTRLAVEGKLSPVHRT